VLGGRGFIGVNLIHALLTEGYLVRSFDRPNVKQLNASFGEDASYEEVEGDFASEADIAQAVVGCDICFHLISTTLPKSSNADPVFDVETNLLGSIRLLNQALKAGIKKIIFLSSGGTVYGTPIGVPITEEHPTDPICSYGITKLGIEKYLSLYRQLYGLEYTVLRLANPFGEWQRVHASQGAVAVFMAKALNGETIEIWGDGTVVRDYIYISDVVAALLLSVKYDGPLHIFNIGSGCGHSINQVLDAIEAVTKGGTKRQYTAARSFDVPVSVLSIERAKLALGWSPAVSFLEGLSRTHAWYQAHGIREL
jgi:UDP-glucose 4-epimerase